MGKIELTRRRILGGLVTIGAGSAAAGAGTFALFSDEETDNATVSAGTLDLQVGNSNTLEFTASDIVPTDDGTASTDLDRGSGSVTADLNITVDSVSSAEGTDSESEDSPGTDGELDDQLELDLWIAGNTNDIVLYNDGNWNSVDSYDNPSNYQTASSYSGISWDGVITDFSNAVTFNVDWQFPDRSDNNDAQGDDITIDFTFELVQQ